MKKEWKWMLAVVVAVLVTAAAPLADPAKTPEDVAAADGWGTDGPTHSLIDVEVSSPSAGPLEVLLVTDGAVPYETLTLADPERFVVDLRGAVNRSTQYRIDVGAAGLAAIRTAQHASDPQPVTRVVFDIDGDTLPVVERRGSSIAVRFGEPSLEASGGTIAEAIAEPAATAPPAEAQAEPLTVAAAGDSAEIDELIRELEARQPQAEPVADSASVAPAPVEAAEATDGGRAVERNLIDELLATPGYSAPTTTYGQQSQTLPSSFETKTIGSGGIKYSGKEISLNLVDADLKQVFRLFHELSGLNFVLDPSVSGRVTIVLDQVPWDQALDIILKNNSLDKVLENNVIRIASTQKLAQEAAARKQLKEAEELEVEPITITRTLSYAKARDVERVIRESGVLTTRGKAIVDERTNTVIISDVPKKVTPLDALISTLDSETPQVMIEARIVETSRDWVQDLGVVWGAAAIADASKGTQTGLDFPYNASVRYGLNLPGAGGASNLAFKFGNVIDSFTLDVALNTLETEGYGRVLSSPKIATQNNERAEIEQGTRIPITNTTATEINVEFVSASLKLMVTPQITAEGTIILDVTVENNSADFVNTSGGVPSIRTQRAQTKVMIADGGTTVIGGIFTVNEGKSEIGVPWFRKVPVFGWLFKSQNITKQNRELLIFITPKIMRAA